MKLRFSGYGRIHVDWLTEEEIERVFQTRMTPQQAVLIGAGLLQGMRRIETLRMTFRDAQDALRTQNLRIRGKGGKERTIPLHEQFGEILRGYLAWSEPGEETKPLLGIKRTRSEELLEEFCKRFGRRFTFHTMRRSFGRALWLKKVELETISEILGHSSTDMTRRYLGLNLSDMRAALQKHQIRVSVASFEHPAP
uniref:tyrosine-type recombinase/integrase n=1 Tax=Methanothrix sp. TaxID=90426 RepID=UPI0034E27AFF